MIPIVFAIASIMPMVADGDCVMPYETIAIGKPGYRVQDLTGEILRRQISYGKLADDQVHDPAILGYVGLVDCSMIGQEVGLTWPSGHVSYPYLVIDCRQRDLALSTDQDWVLAVELDEDEWRRHYTWAEFARREEIRVWKKLTPMGGACIM